MQVSSTDTDLLFINSILPSIYSVLADKDLVVWGLTALWDNISVYIGPSPKEREKEEKG